MGKVTRSLPNPRSAIGTGHPVVGEILSDGTTTVLMTRGKLMLLVAMPRISTSTNTDPFTSH